MLTTERAVLSLAMHQCYREMRLRCYKMNVYRESNQDTEVVYSARDDRPGH